MHGAAVDADVSRRDGSETHAGRAATGEAAAAAACATAEHAAAG